MTKIALVSSLCALAVLGACSSCSHKSTLTPPPGGVAAPAKAGTSPGAFTLVVTGGLVGHLEPCGCSADQRGGVARAAAAVADIRKEGRPVLLIDAGDRFFPGPSAPADPLVAAQQQREAHSMAEVTRAMAFDVLALGSRDAPYRPFFGEEKLPPVLDPGATPAPGTKTAFVQELAGVNVGVFAIGDDDALLAKRAAELESAGARVLVAIVQRSFAATQALVPAAKAAGVDFLIAARVDVPETSESAAAAGTPPVLQVAARGEAILRLDVTANGAGGADFKPVAGLAQRAEELEVMQKRIDLMREDVVRAGPADAMHELKTKKLLELEERRAHIAAAPPPALPADRNAFAFAFVPMSPKLPQEPAVRAIVDDYNAQTATENFAYAKAHPKQCPEPGPGRQSFVGEPGCIDCHSEAAEFWRTTRHSHAYATLVEKNRQYDAACVGCHVTGYEQPGGACDLAQTKDRENVQCESCHGPASLHVVDGEGPLEVAKPDEKVCVKCHDHDNSPHFNYPTYRPQIIGPGHGAPLARKSP